MKRQEDQWMDDSLHSYLLTTIKDKSDDILTIEQYAKENHVPIMEPISMEFLVQLVRITKPKKILEIGAAIGYSAIRMGLATDDSKIVTIERDEERIQEALKNIKAFDLHHRINLIEGDALERTDDLLKKGPYDMLFIDAAKGQYEKFFSIYSPSIVSGGIIVTDNVLFKGYVADLDKSENKRLQKLATKIRHYNEWLIQQPNMKTTILPIGDGIAITVKQ